MEYLGEFVYGKYINKVGNYFKIPDNELQIVQHLQVEENSYKKIASLDYFEGFVRQIDPTIQIEENFEDIITALDFETIKNTCIEKSINYIIVPMSILRVKNDYFEIYMLPHDSLENYSFTEIGRNDDYIIYHFDETLMQINQK